MITINIGKKNDGKMYAVEVDGKLYEMSEADRQFQAADVVIGFDSGVYPGTLQEAVQSILDRAAAQL